MKFDGFRSLCYIVDGDVRLVSRKGHAYRAFRNLCDYIASDVRAEDAVLDGEIVCLDERGHLNLTLRCIGGASLVSMCSICCG